MGPASGAPAPRASGETTPGRRLLQQLPGTIRHSDLYVPLIHLVLRTPYADANATADVWADKARAWALHDDQWTVIADRYRESFRSSGLLARLEELIRVQRSASAKWPYIDEAPLTERPGVRPGVSCGLRPASATRMP